MVLQLIYQLTSNSADALSLSSPRNSRARHPLSTAVTETEPPKENFFKEYPARIKSFASKINE